MSLRDSQGAVFEYPMASEGINMRKSVVELRPTEALFTQNLTFKDGMTKIRGYETVTAAEVSAGNKVTGLHRFYNCSGIKKTLVASGTTIKELNGTAWDTIDATIGQSQTTNTKTHFYTWGALSKCYICNGVDRAIAYDGTTAEECGIATYTVVDYTALGGAVVTLEVDGVTTTLTEAVDWTAATSNTSTATSLASAIDGITGMTGTAVAAVVTATVNLTAHLQDATTDDATNLTLSKTPFLPPTALMVQVYQDRLLAIDPNNAGTLIWSKSFDDTEWENKSATGVRPDTQLFGMSVHSTSNVDVGYKAGILLAGADSMHYFVATDMRTPATTGDYTIYPLATTAGCNAPDTMKWTPAGTIYLGMDRQLYLLEFEKITPIPIGHKLQTTADEAKGIDRIPASRIKDACATYHDDYYKLSITVEGDTKNSTQFWLEMSRLARDIDISGVREQGGTFGPWYGPMLGMNVSVFANQNGPGDAGELLAGDDFGTNGSLVYFANKRGVLSNNGTAISVVFQSYYNPCGEIGLAKDCSEMELELADSATGVTLGIQDIHDELLSSITVTYPTTLHYHNDFFWDDNFFHDKFPARARVQIDGPIQFRRLSATVRHSSSTEDFELFAMRVHTKEQDHIFAEIGASETPV